MKQQQPIFQALAKKINAIGNCVKRIPRNTEWEAKHEEAIEEIMKQTAPSGSGIDCGTKIDMSDSKPNRLVFSASYHHMDDNGFYDGWTEHQIIITPDLANGFDIRITGPDRRQIKEYLYEVYREWLNQETKL